ncbi:winged helix-turn-helix transcriptional regulator [Candidatus Saccharibacteria bacterium]|nr:winged helix-turn-helix transcriptional regulator [Candidatus Saccharibacteria bacterium]
MNPRLYWQIHKLAFLLEKRADENLKAQAGIGFAQFKVLEAIGSNMLAKQNLIASQLDQTEASISRQIKILQKKGLISVASVMGNRRARELSLTEKGEELLLQSVETLDMAQAQIIGALSYQEQRHFQELFERMLNKARQ